MRMTVRAQDVIRYVYWKAERPVAPWHCINDTQEERTKAIRAGAMYFTTMSLEYEPTPEMPEPIRRGPLCLDFDAPDDPGRALDDMRHLCLSFLSEQYGLDAHTIDFYASGSKGFHAVIPERCLGDTTGDPLLPWVHKRMVAGWKAALQLSTLDMSLYCMGRGKMFRIANVKRANGKYKVPLTLHEVQTLSIDKLLRLTEKPREIEPPDGADFDCPDLASYFRACRAEVYAEQREREAAEPVDPEMFKKLGGKMTPCIRYLLSERFVKPKETNFNNLSLLLVQYLQTVKMSLADGLSLAQPFLHRCPSSAYTSVADKEKKFKTQWHFAEGHPAYQFACRYVLAAGFPGNAFECRRCPLSNKPKPAETLPSIDDIPIEEPPPWVTVDDALAGAVPARPVEKVERKPAPSVTDCDITADDLLRMEFPEPRWVVRGLIPTGLTLLAGKPKSGKSLLMSNLAIAFATGGRFLDVPFEGPQKVLLFALEDSKRRLHERFRRMIGDGDTDLSQLVVVFEASRLQAGFENEARKRIERHKPSLAIIDTLAKVKPSSNGRKQAYDEDYQAVDSIKRIADEFEIGVIVVHHTRKMGAEDRFDTVSGTLVGYHIKRVGNRPKFPE
uniref:AAA family ATPase n=1 Tax=Desulfatirhabdium butyrativorans TaxID=340467 RepID=A0A7C4RTU5_9BACT